MKPYPVVLIALNGIEVIPSGVIITMAVHSPAMQGARTPAILLI